MSCEQSTTIELSLPNQLGYEKLARHTLDWLARGLGFESDRIADIQTAVSEACINAIEHGNQGVADRRVHIAFTYASDHLDALIVDEGMTPYHQSNAPVATIEQKLAELAPARGMGLFLISQLVDEARFLPTSHDQGNRYWLRMYRTAPKRTAEASWLSQTEMARA